ncbi:MAG: hypothetical protein AABY22_06875, partial [Nanoarchaeota archaeon]
LKVLNEQEQRLVDELPKLKEQLIYGSESAIVLANSVNQLNTVAPVAAAEVDNLTASVTNFSSQAEMISANMAKYFAGVQGGTITTGIEDPTEKQAKLLKYQVNKLTEGGVNPSSIQNGLDFFSANPAARANAVAVAGEAGFNVSVNIDGGNYIKTISAGKRK